MIFHFYSRKIGGRTYKFIAKLVGLMIHFSFRYFYNISWHIWVRSKQFLRKGRMSRREIWSFGCTGKYGRFSERFRRFLYVSFCARNIFLLHTLLLATHRETNKISRMVINSMLSFFLKGKTYSYYDCSKKRLFLVDFFLSFFIDKINKMLQKFFYITSKYRSLIYLYKIIRYSFTYSLVSM